MRPGSAWTGNMSHVFCLSVWPDDTQPLFIILMCFALLNDTNAIHIQNWQPYWICSWNFHMKQRGCSRSSSSSSSIWAQQALAAATAGGGGRPGAPFISSGCGSSGMCCRSSSQFCLSCRFILFFTFSLFIFYWLEEVLMWALDVPHRSQNISPWGHCAEIKNVTTLMQSVLTWTTREEHCNEYSIRKNSI